MRKGQFPMLDTTVTMYSVVIIAALLLGALFFYLVFVELGSYTLPDGLGEPGKLRYNIEFVKAATQPYAFSSIIAYAKDGDMLEQGIMSMYAQNQKYYDAEFARTLAHTLKAGYFTLEIRDFLDPFKKLTLMKHAREYTYADYLYGDGRCGNLGQGICLIKNDPESANCPYAMKTIEDEFCSGNVGFNSVYICCVENLEAEVERCGPTTNPKLGICEIEDENIVGADKKKLAAAGFCTSGRRLTYYDCKAGKCCIPVDADEYAVSLGIIDGIYSADTPLFYLGKPGYFTVKSSRVNFYISD